MVNSILQVVLGVSEWVSEWVGDYSLMLNQQFYSYIMAITSYIRLNGDDVSK